MAKGRLAAEGRLSDLLAFQVRGWEMVVAGLTPDAMERIGARVRGATQIAAGRYTLELALDQPPEGLWPDLAACGASLVSVNPLRESLEDFFMQRVAEAGQGARITEPEKARSLEKT